MAWSPTKRDTASFAINAHQDRININGSSSTSLVKSKSENKVPLLDNRLKAAGWVEDDNNGGGGVGVLVFYYTKNSNGEKQTLIITEMDSGTGGIKYKAFLSDPFFINSTPTPTPTSASFKIISPNGGERWIINQTYNITWDVGNTDRNKTVTLLLIPEGLNSQCFGSNCWTITTSASNTGSFTWTNAGKSFYGGPAPSAGTGHFKIGIIYDKNTCPTVPGGFYHPSCYVESNNAFTFENN